MNELTTVPDVIKALGGIHAIAQLTGREYGAVWQWTRWPHFPPDTYLVLTAALATRDLSAPAHLWRMVPVEGAPEVVEGKL